MPGIPNSGDFTEENVDDFLNAVTGAFNWTSTATGTGAALSATTAALMSTLKGIGGTTQVIGTVATNVIQQQAAAGIGLGPSAVVGIQMDAVMMLDTALSTATNTYQVLFGISDGTAATENLVALLCGFNPITNAFDMRWALAVDTGTRLIASTTSAQYAAFGQPIALDIPQHIRLRISPDWKTVQGWANGIASPVFSVGSAFGGSTAATITPITTGGLMTYGGLCVAGTANTVKIIFDVVSFSLIGRPQFM